VKFTRQADGSCAGTFVNDQDRKELKLDLVAFNDSALRFELKKDGLVYEGRLSEDGSQLVGQWKQGGVVQPLIFRRQAAEATFARPQEPKRPYPYREEEVTYPGARAGVKFAGTLTLPRGKGPFPAVRLFSASYHDRDKTAFGHKPFLVLADHLTRCGIAVLRVDTQEFGGPNGAAATSAEPTGLFVEEALASIDYLKTRKEIDPARIGLIGHSEGGLVAPLVATRRRDVAFLVLLAGRGLKGEENLYLMTDLSLRVAGADEKSRALVRRLYEVLCRLAREHKDDMTTFQKFEHAWGKDLGRLASEGQPPVSKSTLWTILMELKAPWYRFYLTYDPQPTLRQVQCPVLALAGEKDLNVPAKENLPKIKQALAEGGNKDYTVSELPGLNHLFQTCRTGHIAEYGTLEETFAPAALKRISGWILQRVGTERPVGSK
jgi:dienelactone hydrolase